MQLVFNDGGTSQVAFYNTLQLLPHGPTVSHKSTKVKADLHVAGQKKFGLTQGLATTTLRLAVPTLPALSAAEYVTV